MRFEYSRGGLVDVGSVQDCRRFVEKPSWSELAHECLPTVILNHPAVPGGRFANNNVTKPDISLRARGATSCTDQQTEPQSEKASLHMRCNRGRRGGSRLQQEGRRRQPTFELRSIHQLAYRAERQISTLLLADKKQAIQAARKISDPRAGGLSVELTTDKR
jgi:hypothetical protein